MLRLATRCGRSGLSHVTGGSSGSNVPCGFLPRATYRGAFKRWNAATTPGKSGSSATDGSNALKTTVAPSRKRNPFEIASLAVGAIGLCVMCYQLGASERHHKEDIRISKESLEDSRRAKITEERRRLYKKIRAAESVEDFYWVLRSDLYQDALNRISRAMEGPKEDIDEAAKAWALRMRQGRPSDRQINQDRKVCLDLLYTMCDKLGESNELKKFGKLNIVSVLQICLPLDRAQALYHMQYNRLSDRHGMHWVSMEHLKTIEEWRKVFNARLDDYGEVELDPSSTMTPCMNRRLMRLNRVFELDKSNDDIKAWLEPVWQLEESETTPEDKLDVPNPHEITEVPSKATQHSLDPRPKMDEEPFGKKPKELGRYSAKSIDELLAMGRRFQFDNSRSGMVLYRGGQNYDNEKTSLQRIKTYKKRKHALKKLLVAIHDLRVLYVQHGSGELGSKNDIVSTVRAMALAQHYGEILEVQTPMLDVTRDLRVATSFAFLDDLNPERKRCVRMLLVGRPYHVERTDPVRTGSIETPGSLPMEKGYEWLVRRLGDSDMLVIALQELLPPQALRPQNQAGMVLVHKSDILAIHKLVLELHKAVENDVPLNPSTPILEELLKSDEAKTIIGDEELNKDVGWDARDYSHFTVEVPDQDARWLGPKFWCNEVFPKLKRGSLYPPGDKDPILFKRINRLKDQLQDKNF